MVDARVGSTGPPGVFPSTGFSCQGLELPPGKRPFLLRAFSCLEKGDTRELFDTVFQGVEDLTS